MNLLVVTDLDGSLLDGRDYSFEPARGALEALARRGIPLAACSSKTRAEMLVVLAEMGLGAPFAAENGGGVFFPDTDAWRRVLRDLRVSGEQSDGLLLVRSGPRYVELLEAMAMLRARGFALRGFAEMSVEEIGRLTGLDLGAAHRARQREFDECFIAAPGSELDLPALERAARDLGYCLTRGRLLHLLGRQDKGRALRLLRDAYQGYLGTPLHTIAVGDGWNDLPMLRKADTAVLVPGPDGRPRPELMRALRSHSDLITAPQPGPAGWARALLSRI